MPGNRHDALVGEFTSALETLLGDYLKTREARRPIGRSRTSLVRLPPSVVPWTPYESIPRADRFDG